MIPQGFKLHCAGNELQDHNDCTPHSIPEQTQQDVKECEDCDEIVSTSQAGAENISQDASEVVIRLLFSGLL